MIAEKNRPTATTAGRETEPGIEHLITPDSCIQYITIVFKRQIFYIEVKEGEK